MTGLQKNWTDLEFGVGIVQLEITENCNFLFPTIGNYRMAEEET
jgi:hypothetical protein